MTASTVLIIWVQVCFPSPLACKIEFSWGNSALPQVHNTAHYSSSVISGNWYFQKTTKISTAGCCIVKEHRFHTSISGIKKPQNTRPPQLLKAIKQSRKLQKAQFCLSLALLSRELTILVSNVCQTRRELGRVPRCIP